jgi:hypothetical protein
MCEGPQHPRKDGHLLAAEIIPLGRHVTDRVTKHPEGLTSQRPYMTTPTHPAARYERYPPYGPRKLKTKTLRSSRQFQFVRVG